MKETIIIISFINKKHQLFHDFSSQDLFVIIQAQNMQKAFELTLKFGKIPVFSLPHIENKVLGKVQACKKFRDYVDRCSNPEKGVVISKIQILGVEMFGQNVGFVNLRACTEKDGFKLPAYLFLRGHAVGILMFVNHKILLVQQYRVPIQQTMLEVPAGMIDESGDFVGVAAKEIEEETGLKLKKEQLQPLGSYYPSCGGSDEEIFLFYCHIKISEEELQVIEQKIHGEGTHQRIKVKLVDYDPVFFLNTKDSKLICALYAYENLVKSKKSNL